MILTYSTRTSQPLRIPAALPTPLHIGIAAGLARAAQLQRAPVTVPAAVLAQWGNTGEAFCTRVLAELERCSEAASRGPQLALHPALIDTYLGLYLPMPDVLIQPFAPGLLTWSDIGSYALLAAGYRQPTAALARLQELGLVTRAQVAVAPAELLTLLDQAAAGFLTTLDDAGRRVRAQLTQQGRGQQQLCRVGRVREAAC